MGVYGSVWECMGVYGSVWECMGVYGGRQPPPRTMLRLGGNVSQKSQSFPKSPKPSQKKPPSTILPAYAANQNHRLSRWYAPRLQGDGTGSPTRALNYLPLATTVLQLQIQ